MAHQLEAYAFSVWGYAVAIPDSIGNNIITLRARHPTTTPLDSAIEKNGIRQRNNLEFTPEEKNTTNDDDENTEKYLLIGLTLPSLDKAYVKKHPKQAKQTPVGTELYEDALIPGETPTMVVTPINKLEHSETTKLYALADPKDNLCTPFSIKQEVCFYLPLYRDNTTAIQARKTNWNKNLRTRGVGLVVQPKSATKKLLDSSKMSLDSRQTIGGQLLAMVSMAMTDEGGDWGIRALQTLSEMYTRESPPKTALKSLVDLDIREWDDEMSVKFITELGTEHSEDKVKALGIKPEEVSLLKKTLLNTQIQIDEARVISFSQLGINAIRRARRDNQSPELSLRQSVEIWQDQLDWAEPSPAISAEQDSDLARILLAIEEALRNIIANAESKTRALLAEAGDVQPKTLDEVIARFAEDLTRDGFKQTVSELYWLVTMKNVHLEEGTIHSIRQILSIVDHVLPKLRATAGDPHATDNHGAASNEENIFGSDDDMEL